MTEQNFGGWLQKKGKKHKAWKKRWFVLSDDKQLRYYTADDATPKTQKGTIDLSLASSISSAPEKFGIGIVTPTRIWHLRALDSNSQEQWIGILRATISPDKHKKKELRVIVPEQKEAIDLDTLTHSGGIIPLKNIYNNAFMFAEQAKLHDSSGDLEKAYRHFMNSVELFLYAGKQEQNEKNLSLLKTQIDLMLQRTEHVKAILNLEKFARKTPKSAGESPHTPSSLGRIRSWKKKKPPVEEKLKGQFGVDISELECIHVAGYESHIPQVLVTLRKCLIENGGLDSEGIFRLAPDARDCKKMKEEFNEGTFDGSSDDENCYANLLKIWYRDLPEHVLDQIDAGKLTACSQQSDIPAVIDLFSEPNKSLFLWLLDLCVEVSNNFDVNKMTPKNLAIVFTPNLFDIGKLNPMMAMTHNQKVTDFFELSIIWKRSLVY